jgi:hypothetical protein
VAQDMGKQQDFVNVLTTHHVTSQHGISNLITTFKEDPALLNYVAS